VYEGWASTYYDSFAAGLDGDVEFYIGEARREGSPVLELGCGTGRISIPIAEADVDIVGLDLSGDMLAIAQEKVKKRGPGIQQRIEFIQGDMSDFSLGRQFRLVMIPYRSFLALTTADRQRQSLARIREHLVPGGALVLNIYDPRLDLITSPLNGTRRQTVEFRREDSGHRVVTFDTRRYDPESQAVEQDLEFEELDERGVVLAKAQGHVKTRFAYRYEMQYLLELSGFRVEALFGDFHGGSFSYGREQVWRIRKA
jgi:ubiquinone/menaquinone biosynthesis C-methylase UbiE